MKYIARIFMNGILALLPIIITLYIVLWLLRSFEHIFKTLILLLAPDLYFPGLGILLGVVAIFAAGVLMQAWGLRTIYKYGEQLLEKFPIVGDIYSTLKSFMQYATSSSSASKEQVVLIDYQGMKVIGIVTSEDLSEGPKEIANNDIIAVYLPMSYQLGGYTVYLSRKNVTPIAMSKKAALQWVITGGVSSTKKPSEIKKE